MSHLGAVNAADEPSGGGDVGGRFGITRSVLG